MDDVEALMRDVRATFRSLAAYSGSMTADLGVNPSMRAVMEFIHENGPATAADMARTKQVSRQHIQNIVDQLYRASLAEARDNPGHKRAVLVALTARGESVFSKIREREIQALATIAARMTGADLGGACETLARLRGALADAEEGDPA